MSLWTSIRDAVESVGNAFTGGLATPLVSQGAQRFAATGPGRLLDLAGGIYTGSQLMSPGGGTIGDAWNAMTGAPATTGAPALTGAPQAGMTVGDVASFDPTGSSPVMDWFKNTWSGGPGGTTGGGIKGWLGPLMSVGSGLYGLNMQKQLMDMAKGASPWLTSGGMARAGGQLNDVLMGGSNAYEQTPAFKARMRAAAATSSMAPGGPEAVAAASAGGAGYNDWVNQMAMLSGAQFSPGTAVTAATGTVPLASSALGSIGYGVTQATGGNTMIPPAVQQWLLQNGMVPGRA